MKCEDIRSHMMDYLYNELSKEERDSFDSHLAQCDNCRKEVESLKTASGILRQWEDADTEINPIHIRYNPSLIAGIKEYLSNLLTKPRRMAIGLAYGLTAIFLVLAIGSMEISVKDGNFEMRVGLLSNTARHDAPNELYTQQLVERLFNENIRLTGSLIQESETRQREELAYVLLALQKDIERQRYQDLNLVGYGLNSIQKNTNQQIQQIDYTLTELMRPDNAGY